MRRAAWRRDRAPAAASGTWAPRLCSRPRSSRSPVYWRGNLPAQRERIAAWSFDVSYRKKRGSLFWFYLVHLPVVLLILGGILRDLWIKTVIMHQLDERGMFTSYFLIPLGVCVTNVRCKAPLGDISLQKYAKFFCLCFAQWRAQWRFIKPLHFF